MPAASVDEPRYSRAVPVSEDMIQRRPRQIIALPSEPGEAGEDPLRMSGGVIGRLPADLHRFPEGHVIAGMRASLHQLPDWIVCYVADARLAISQSKEAAEWIERLEQGRVPEGLSQVCEAKNIHLAAETIVTAEEPGRFWRISDPKRVLFVQRDADALIVRAALPLRVLPNKTMMMMEAIVGNADKPPAFAITGRITEFQGTNYILLEHLSEVMSTAAASPAKASEPSEETADATASGQADGDVADGGGKTSDREPKPEDIIKHLLDSKPRRAVVLPEALPTAPESKSSGPIAEGRPEQQTWPEDTMIVDRPGRIVPTEKWWQFSFEDKALVSGRKPVRLLPNRMLENAIALGGDQSLGTILIVSGEVTEYRGTNYLLLRKVLVQRDMGNLN